MSCGACCFPVLLLLSFAVTTMPLGGKSCDDASVQPASEVSDTAHPRSVKSLLSALAHDDSELVETLLDAKWTPSTAVFRELFVALDATQENEWRFALEKGIERTKGNTKERIEFAKKCIEPLTEDANENVRRIAEYYSDIAMPYDFSDEQNCQRMQLTNSTQDSIRWLAVRHLSCSRRYYLIESEPVILFVIASRTPKMAIPCLVDQLESDASEAVRLVSLEGLWWYYRMDQISDDKIVEVLRNAKQSPSQKLADLASAYEIQQRSRTIAIQQSVEK